eukprot:g2256.t1
MENDEFGTTFNPPHSWNCTHPLNRNTALDYFAHKDNPFYDRTCNNEMIRMQGVPLSQLRLMTGLEYGLMTVDEPGHIPGVYVIAKQYRSSEHEVELLALYYIAGHPPVIFRAPDVHRVAMARLDVCAFHALAAHKVLRAGVRHVPSQGPTWEFGDAGAGAGAGPAHTDDGDESDESEIADAARRSKRRKLDGSVGITAAGNGSEGGGERRHHAEGECRGGDTKAAVAWTGRRQAQHVALFEGHKPDLFGNARAIDAILRCLESKQLVWNASARERREGAGGAAAAAAHADAENYSEAAATATATAVTATATATTAAES